MAKVKFLPWEKWINQRKLFKDKNYPTKYPGVYLLANSGKVPTSVNPIPECICYIGETRRTLRKRLNDFHRSAFENKRGHSGGKTYGKNFLKKNVGKELYCSIYPVKHKDKQIRDAHILYIERKLIWDYVKKWKELPACNKR